MLWRGPFYTGCFWFGADWSLATVFTCLCHFWCSQLTLKYLQVTNVNALHHIWRQTHFSLKVSSSVSSQIKKYTSSANSLKSFITWFVFWKSDTITKCFEGLFVTLSSTTNHYMVELCVPVLFRARFNQLFVLFLFYVQHVKYSLSKTLSVLTEWPFLSILQTTRSGRCAVVTVGNTDLHSKLAETDSS